MSVRPVTTESYGTDRGGAGYLYTVLLLTILFAALKLSGVISWSWWWVFRPMWLLAALWAYQIAAAAIFARIMKPRSKRDPMAEATLDISVTSGRGLEAGRSGRAPELTVEVRSTVYGSAIDWSAVANREQLTDQVLGVIAGMQPDARAWIERDLSELGWR